MKSFSRTVAFVAGGLLLSFVAPVMANGNVQWSVTVGSPGYYYAPPAAPPPPPVVIYPQSQFIYGAPPSVYSPPAVYVQPAPVIPVYPSGGWRNHYHGNPHQHRENWWQGGRTYGGPEQRYHNGGMGAQRWNHHR